MNIARLVREVFVDKETTINWCRNAGLLHQSRTCRKCNSVMTFDVNIGSCGRWRCHRKALHANKEKYEVSGGVGTWFENSRLDIEKSLILMNCWSDGFNYEQARSQCHFAENERLSDNTISDWYNYCREVCMISLDELYETNGKIGGAGHIVEIDECKVGKRKYNRGRMVDGTWIFGMIDLGSLDEPAPPTAYRLEICPDNVRNEATLIPLLQKHVRPNTTIISDGWLAYQNIPDYGYNHLTVNHTYNFVDPNTFAHTQTIESSWRALKRSLHQGGVKKDDMAIHLCEYLYRREVKKNHRNLFETLVSDIARIYDL